jgi:hypothetical protein
VTDGDAEATVVVTVEFTNWSPRAESSAVASWCTGGTTTVTTCGLNVSFFGFEDATRATKPPVPDIDDRSCCTSPPWSEVSACGVIVAAAATPCASAALVVDR